MGQDTKIQWCDHTFNPWIGCAHATLDDGTEHPACKNCYAEVGAQARIKKSQGLPLWGADAHRHRTSADYWKQPAKWDRAAAAAGVRHRVFCASNADVFEDRADLAPRRADLARVIADTPNLNWLLLTKRPNLGGEMWEVAWADGTRGHARRDEGPWLKSIWLGTSISDQPTADELVPRLLQVPAAVRFLSVEPQLGAVDLSAYLPPTRGTCSDGPCDHSLANDRAAVGWVIVGGESGPHARPFDLAWARSLRDQCAAAGVSYFLKQLGSNPWPDLSAADDAGCLLGSTGKRGDPAEWPGDLQGCRAWPEARP